MLHKTEGLVLRTVKYSESSVIVMVFTELFGIQSYLVNGVRSSSAKRNRANLLQPGNLLEMVAYHREIKNLQRLSEFKLAYIYQGIQLDIVKNAVALFLIELLQHSLHQPEAQPELFAFVKEAFCLLDREDQLAANLPLFFTLKLGQHLGFGLSENHSPERPYLNLQEGFFVSAPPHHPYYLDITLSEITAKFLSVRDIRLISSITLNKAHRRNLLEAYLEYFRLHLPDFRGLKSPVILQELLGI